MMKHLRLVAGLLGAAVALPSSGAIDWIITPPGSATVTQAITGEIEVVFSSASTDSLVTLRGSANDAMFLVLSNTSSVGKKLSIEILHLNFPTQTMGSISTMTLQATNGSPIEIKYLETTGDVRDIVGSRVIEARVGGDLGVNDGAVVLFAPAVGGNGSVEFLQVGGDLVGDVCVAGGGIDFLQVLGDNGIGQLSEERLIKTKEAIKHIRVPDGAIYADILAGGFSGGANPDIGRIFALNGVFQATSAGIMCRKFDDIAGAGNPPGLFCPEGDLGANVTLSEALGVGREIIVGGHFTTDHVISLPSVSGANGGLRGQITFNTLGQSYAWNGDIRIGGTTLTGEPYYTNTAASIGGGSAGLATFNVHNSSCVPPHGASVPGEAPTLNCLVECCPIFTKVALKFYGPATLVGASPHATVEWYYEVAGAFIPVGWTVATAYPSSGDHHFVEVKRADSGYWPLGFYRIKPITNKIASEGVAGSPNVVAFEYYFLLTGCDQDSLSGFFDQNGDDLVNAADLATWASEPSNLNADSVINGDDLYKLFLASLAFPTAPEN